MSVRLYRIFINECCSVLCSGRRKRSLVIVAVLMGLMLMMIFLCFDVLSPLKHKKNNSWIIRLLKDQHSYIDKSGMPVIVGHYIGGSSVANWSDEVVNSNNYMPVPGAGEGGRPVILSPRELIYARDLYGLHSYNILVSDRISINRSLPDMRSESCINAEIETHNLPLASVIIVFHNEAWSTLMRTVMSVILRSPESLLKEIILVDDASERRYLGKELEDAISGLKIVRLLRNKIRSGLVGARLKGAQDAAGDVLVFLDAHCEVTKGWLEPLLDRAGSDDVFVCPHIDLLSDETLAYTKSMDAHWGAFSWRLHFRWLTPSSEIMMEKEQHPSKPYPTPAMAGGLFAVRRSLFWRLGGYDKGMSIWGAENLELSWRAWQCGARVEITPCSRVGHIFRTRSPYTYPGGVFKVLNSNLARAATVWMDEWADFFFKFNPAVAAIRDQQDVSDRVRLRESLRCKSFKWYLENVWPQHFFPNNSRWFGRMRNGKGFCLGVIPSGTPGLGGPASGIKCGNDLDLDKLVVYTPEGQIMADEGLCLEVGSGRVVWRSCRKNRKQIWQQKGPRLKTEDGLCLTMMAGGGSLDLDPLKTTKNHQEKGKCTKIVTILLLCKKKSFERSTDSVRNTPQKLLI